MKQLPPFLLLCSIALFTYCTTPTETIQTEVLVIGEGTGATAAAIQSARSGAKTILINPQPWLGGMLTAAGVSASDGNHELPAGIWGEFRALLRQHYGGPDSVSTGWISFTLFEPHVGAQYFKQLAEKEANLSIWYNTNFTNIKKDQNWIVETSNEQGTPTIEASILIDGTDLGDVAALTGASFDVGMDGKISTGESMAPEQANSIIQDLTYVAILKDYGPDADRTIPKPEGYDPTPFYCSCKANCEDDTAHPCETMLTYAKLPRDKYMINWPIYGNDYYVNAVDYSPAERAAAYEKAKQQTLKFVYYIQKELGYKNLGLADDEFPTADSLALMPYHREGRRIQGKVQLNVTHMLHPFDDQVYRTGVIVGDYPIDHHHDMYEGAPEIDFPAVPSFNIPLGALLPKEIDNLIMADKAISVTNIVNGSSRLQPVVLQIGQTAGLIAAMAIKEQKAPDQLPIRMIQQAVLDYKGYLMPYIDVNPSHPHFEAIQRIGATGILRGKGIPYKWANQTWFYPDSTINSKTFFADLKEFEGQLDVEEGSEAALRLQDLMMLSYQWLQSSSENKFAERSALEMHVKEAWTKEWQLQDYDSERALSRAEIAVVLDRLIHPFELKQVSFEGVFE